MDSDDVRERFSPAEPRVSARPPTRRHVSLWATVAVVLTIAGVLGAVFGARTVARSAAQQQRLASHLTAAEIGSELKLAIRREEDLTISTSAFVASNPNVTPAAFDRWLESISAFRRYPELQNIGLVKLVSASELGAFLAHEASSPLRPLGAQSVSPSEGVQVVPAGRRPYYCLAAAGMASEAATYVPAGLDYCELIAPMITTRDSGLTGYAPIAGVGAQGLGVSTPVYRTGVTPATVQGRRQAFLGWLGERIQPQALLQTALAGHPGAAVVFHFNALDSHVAFASGKPPAGAQSTTIPVALGREVGLQQGEGWTVQSLSASASASVFSNTNAFIVLVVGSLLSLLIGLLISTLGTGRTRALALVRGKTRELSEKNRELVELALHDPLTGLPNRSLVLDRAERMLARSARDPDVVAGALYVDVDRFKDINDSLGHAAGDLLLTVVGQRLQSAVRDQDTVGRLGGDEFIVLVESSTDDPTLEPLANRMIELLREPIDIGGTGSRMSVTVSIGLAVGRYDTPDQLMRDADLALYAAKAAGKDRCTVFDASLRPNGTDPALRSVSLGSQTR